MRSWRSWLGIAISLAFLAFAFRGQDISSILDTLGETDYRLLVPALAFYFAGVWIRAIRWSVLLRPLARVGARQVFPIVVVGYTANNVLPLRTGELVRAYLLGRQTGIRKTSSLATIAVERLFDGLTMLGFMLAATTVVSFTSQLRHLTLVAFTLFVSLLIGLFLLTLGGTFRDKVLQLVLGPLPVPMADRVERLAESFLSGLGVLKRGRDLGIVAGTSLAAWLSEAAMYWTVARALGTDLSSVLGVGETLLTTGVANMATLIPSSPGYVGPFEAGILLVVNGALGVQRELALSYAILVHAALFFPITIIGSVIWWRKHLSLDQLRDIDAEPERTEYETYAPATRSGAAERTRGEPRSVKP
ncbi:MAG TPA: lysylphosphatidylglycerol synthase transmembrane domain-containing protein [Thermomicrobiales bacterium]|nr:lysylphosphatidylglycerol synthase transmembrane domain-containing protein [Thermomicrobiales bacterium]